MLTGLWINRLQIIIFFCKYIAASLVIVVIVSGIFFFFFKLHKYNKIQYSAVTQNINTILYDCTLPNLQKNIVNYLHESELQ